MKLMERMRQKNTGNEGFSLVELIIVIAIMAILLGIVGTQVIPYLNRAREAKDLQIINSYSTAAVTVYSSNAEDFAADEVAGTERVSLVSGGGDTNTLDGFRGEIQELVGYSSVSSGDGNLQASMSSKLGKTITDVQITINFSTGVVTAQGLANGTPVLGKVESFIGTVSGH